MGYTHSIIRRRDGPRYTTQAGKTPRGLHGNGNGAAFSRPLAGLVVLDDLFHVVDGPVVGCLGHGLLAPGDVPLDRGVDRVLAGPVHLDGLVDLLDLEVLYLLDLGGLSLLDLGVGRGVLGRGGRLVLPLDRKSVV